MLSTLSQGLSACTSVLQSDKGQDKIPHAELPPWMLSALLASLLSSC